MLYYEKLLETKKPYITNVYAVSALHSLLLFARIVDTNKDCSRYVVDNWLEIKLEHPQAGETLITVVHQLRLMLRNMLLTRLASPEYALQASQAKINVAPIDEQLLSKLPHYIQNIKEHALDSKMECSEEDLSLKLAEFLAAPILFKLRKLKHSELNALFHTSKKEKEEENEKAETVDAMKELEAAQEATTEGFDAVKEGVKITAWLRYGSILEEGDQSIFAGFSSYMSRRYHCNDCGGDFFFNLEQLQQHISECKKDAKVEVAPSNEPERDISEASNEGGYFCETCKKNYAFGPIQILKHKKLHST
eukprot:TRINITY_DN6273_c0_g1_i1.p1 TRINITY_DN6273_c0_g1~~TRINITY_DN6273_c0_g1_i1.p1  ORF type:complete len:307 (-),score=104.57 TRINITY_DN6273_c0_g1_i1:210-1130(-)